MGGKAEGCRENCMEIARWYLPCYEDTLPLHWKSSFTPRQACQETNEATWKERDGHVKGMDRLDETHKISGNYMK